MLNRLRLITQHTLCHAHPPRTPVSNMSTFTLPHSSPAVPVNLTSDLTQEQLLSFPAFKTWLSTLQHSLSLQKQKSHPFHSTPYILRKIDIQSVDWFGNRLGFVKLKAEATNDNGEKLPGSVFLRGGSVAMMVSSPFPFQTKDSRPPYPPPFTGAPPHSLKSLQLTLLPTHS